MRCPEPLIRRSSALDVALLRLYIRYFRKETMRCPELLIRRSSALDVAVLRLYILFHFLCV
jgi:hypothetical protein